MPRKVAVVLREISEAIEGIEKAVSGKSFFDFETDWLLRHGVQRGIEIIFEASRHLPSALMEGFQTPARRRVINAEQGPASETLHNSGQCAFAGKPSFSEGLLSARTGGSKRRLLSGNQT